MQYMLHCLLILLLIIYLSFLFCLQIENGIRPPITCLPTKDVATATAGTTEGSNTFEALSRAVELTTACWKSEPSQRLPMHVADKLLKEIITSYN